MDIEVKSVAPILRLQSDLWTAIARFLEYDDISHLLTTSNRALALAVGHGVHSISAPRRIASVDLDALLHTCRFLPHLKELLIEPGLLDTRLMMPRKPVSFPPTLTSLTASFYHSLAFFSNAHRIDTLLPGLRSLKLRSAGSWHPLMSAFKLPKTLELLVVHGGLFKLSTGDIAKLPRSLTHLEMEFDKLYTMTRYEWPPNLAVLWLRLSQSSISPELLPRTVQKLTLSAISPMKTTYKAVDTADNFFFPWRAFFPFLHHASFMTLPPRSGKELLATLIATPSHETSQIATFIENDAWNVPGLEFDPKRSYPLFESLKYPGMDFSLDSYGLWAPLLKMANLVVNKTLLLRPDNLALLPSATELDLGRYPLTVTTLASSSVRTLHANLVNDSILQHLPNLTWITDRARAEDRRSMEDVKWPPNLKHLKSPHVFSAAAMAGLPSSITQLILEDVDTSAWTVIASTMVCLTSFILTIFRPGLWKPTRSMTPFKSLLESLELHLWYEAPNGEYGSVLQSLFGPNAVSPFPQSLTSLRLYTQRQHIPMTIGPFLPRQLRVLAITRATFGPSLNFLPDAQTISQSPAQLLGSLPPHLFSLDLVGEGTAVRAPSIALSALPRSISQLSLSGIILNDATEEEVAMLVPPCLAVCSLAPLLLTNVYLEKRRPYLYNGESKLS